ncbi:hypothetical protein AB0I10_18430 [Streptomyces sp. NPDC050636]|uniref:hypothetical protein n=1 Tax=Streptomyces sp. NPDC050636 TaxID=3154510 RepID=UPI00342E4175
MEPVLETSDTSGFAPWPVADLPAYDMLALSGELSSLEVGTAMAALVGDQAGTDDAGSAAALISRLLDEECVILQGGVRVHDPDGGVTVQPGCCFGLESWRDWLDFTRGETPWLGHAPEPYAEHHGPVVRLWPEREQAHTRPIEIRTAELPDLLKGVQDGLRGFLRLVERWADQYAPSLAAALTARLDEDLGIGGPLEGERS